jgi:23S rRNA (pseudouridine1915-N3)-methyltransferase
MKLVVVAEGKLKEPAWRSLADEYLRRLARYAPVEEVEVPKANGLLLNVPEAAFVVALEVDGEAPDSRGFARLLEGWRSRGKGTVAFLIGGAEGIPEAASRAADYRLSLSRLTLPHRLARVLLLEQLYRAMTISRGEPYAREG